MGLVANGSFQGSTKRQEQDITVERGASLRTKDNWYETGSFRIASLIRDSMAYWCPHQQYIGLANGIVTVEQAEERRGGGGVREVYSKELWALDIKGEFKVKNIRGDFHLHPLSTTIGGLSSVVRYIRMKGQVTSITSKRGISPYVALLKES